MRALIVVGLRSKAGEGAVAAALAAVLRRNGTDTQVVKPLEEYDLDVSPVIAAGSDLDLAATLRDDVGTVMVAMPGGILAALSQQKTTRDLAAELRVPVILAVPAGGDATNLARLSLATARSARLTVPAVVLTNWPETPERAQEDERRLLGRLAGVSVLTLPESPSARADWVRDWPVTDWLDAVPPEPEPEPVSTPRAPGVPRSTQAPAPRPTGSVNLEPFAGWEMTPTGDPRSTPRPRMMDALVEIVAAEGPMRATRAYALYNRASGGKKLTTTARTPLENSVKWLVQERRLEASEPAGQDDLVVRAPDTPEVRARELGDRTLEEVPLDEIAELMRRLQQTNRARNDDELKRGVLQTYGLVRLTQRADEYLQSAIGLL